MYSEVSEEVKDAYIDLKLELNPHISDVIPLINRFKLLPGDLREGKEPLNIFSAAERKGTLSVDNISGIEKTLDQIVEKSSLKDVEDKISKYKRIYAESKGI